MLHAHAEQMEDARRRNVSASDLAMKPVPYKPELLPARVGVEIKLDGIGILDVNGTVQTIQGVEFIAARHLQHELDAIRNMFGEPMVLHGEFLERGGFNATLSAFQSGESRGGIVVLWDAVTLKAWLGHAQSPPLDERRAMLETAIQTVRPNMVTLNPLQLLLGNSQDRVTEALQAALANRHEGIVVKDMDSPYVRGPSPFWLKAKGVETIDARIQGVRMHDDVERMKAVIVTLDGKPAFVGSGFTEAQRVDPSDFAIGRWIEIRHLGRMPSGALKSATFVRFRDDKKGPHDE